MSLAQHVSERSNLVTPVRLALALTVAVWHGTGIAGAAGVEIDLHGLSPSYLAVNGFFVLSGFLIAQSLARRDLAHYAAGRILRLFPALIVLLAWGTAFAALLHIVDPDMANTPGDWLYPLKALLFVDASGTLPGLFAGSPETAFSLPLWSLRYEALAYLALPAVAALGLLARPVRVWALWAVAAGGYSVLEMIPGEPAILHEGLRLAAAFLLGSAIYGSRHRLRAGPVQLLVALVAAVALYPTPMFEAAADLVLAWVLFFVCFPAVNGRLSAVVRPLSRMPDLSYGLYIWHWPVFQTLKLVFPEADVAFLLGAGLPLSLIVAGMSWTFAERPALAGKEAFAAWLRTRGPRPAAAAAAA